VSASSRACPQIKDPALIALVVIGLAIFTAAQGLLPLSSASATGPFFPPFAGRVVDGAGVLTPEVRTRLDAKLKATEEKTSDQVVVATVLSLGGLSIDQYANQLFARWEISRDGALLLVAPNERLVRIEVGYGLASVLTDAVSTMLLNTVILPKFRQGDFAGGVEAGVNQILALLDASAQGTPPILGEKDIETIIKTAQSNEIRFKRDFKGRPFKATLPVNRISENYFTEDRYTATFGNNLFSNNVTCEVKDRHTIDLMMDWDKGQIVAVAGNIGNARFGDIELKDCQYDPNPATNK